MLKPSWKLLSLLPVVAIAASHPPVAAQIASTPPPVMNIPVHQNSVTVRLENQTPEAITYEALGDTQPRLLTTGDQVILQNLNTPTTLTVFYQDIQKNRQSGEGLLRAFLEMDEDTNSLNVVIAPTNRVVMDVSNIIIESNGNVFVF